MNNCDSLPEIFSPVSNEELELFKPFVRLKEESNIGDVLVKGDGKIWYLNKIGNVDLLRTQRARFVYLLSQPFANVAEIQILTEEAAQALRKIGFNEASSQCFIIREASSYARGELLCKSLDEAMAAELVFSLWIRRRDAHNENRSFTCDGLPVFFDFDVAFSSFGFGEKLEEFFGRNDPGYPGQWKLFEVHETDLPITTFYSKKNGRQNSVLPVKSIGEFKNHCNRVARLIQSDSRNYGELASQATVDKDEQRRILSILTRNKSAIVDEVETMLKVVTQGLI